MLIFSSYDLSHETGADYDFLKEQLELFDARQSELSDSVVAELTSNDGKVLEVFLNELAAAYLSEQSKSLFAFLQGRSNTIFGACRKGIFEILVKDLVVDGVEDPIVKFVRLLELEGIKVSELSVVKLFYLHPSADTGCSRIVEDMPAKAQEKIIEILKSRLREIIKAYINNPKTTATGIKGYVKFMTYLCSPKYKSLYSFNNTDDATALELLDNTCVLLGADAFVDTINKGEVNIKKEQALLEAQRNQLIASGEVAEEDAALIISADPSKRIGDLAVKLVDLINKAGTIKQVGAWGYVNQERIINFMTEYLNNPISRLLELDTGLNGSDYASIFFSASTNSTKGNPDIKGCRHQVWQDVGIIGMAIILSTAMNAATKFEGY